MTAPHPDDEALSAVLDGEATSDEVAHAGSCVACEQRLTELRLASRAVAEPPPTPAAEQREASLAAALAALDASGDEEREGSDVVVPLASRRRAAPPTWLVAAAVLLVVVLAVPLVSSLTGGDGDGEEDAGVSSLALEAPESAGLGDAAPSPVHGGDLGELDAASDLRGPLADALGAPGADATGRSSTDATGGAGTDADDGAGGGAVGGAESGDDATAMSPYQAPEPVCEAAVRADAPRLGLLRYVADARFDGVPAEVLAFEVPDDGDGSTFRLDVRATDDCRLLATQTFTLQ